MIITTEAQRRREMAPYFQTSAPRRLCGEIDAGNFFTPSNARATDMVALSDPRLDRGQDGGR